MAKLHYNKVAASAWVATSNQVGYGPANLADEALAKPWYSTSLAANDITITFAAPTLIQTLELHDVNFGTATIEKSPDGATFIGLGVATFYAGKEGRRRGLITVNDAAVKALKIKVAAGASLDGLAFWRAGASYQFANVITIPSPFQFDYNPKFIYPEVRIELPTKQVARARTGIGFHEIVLPFMPQDSEDLTQFTELTRAGTTLLELGLANYPYQVWPVQAFNPELDERFPQPKYSNITYTLREVVTS